MQNIIIYTIAVIAGTFLMAWIFSIVFQSKKQVNLLRLQANLLIKMAEKSGVTKDEIEGMINSTVGPKIEYDAVNNPIMVKQEA